MADLMPRVSDALHVTREGAELVSRVPRRVVRAVDAEVGRGLVRAARALADTHVADVREDGAAMVAGLGLRRAAELHRQAAYHLEQTPTRDAADDFRAITGMFTAVVVNELGKLSRE
jgi:hypothetical protein